MIIWCFWSISSLVVLLSLYLVEMLCCCWCESVWWWPLSLFSYIRIISSTGSVPGLKSLTIRLFRLLAASLAASPPVPKMSSWLLSRSSVLSSCSRLLMTTPVGLWHRSRYSRLLDSSKSRRLFLPEFFVYGLEFERFYCYAAATWLLLLLIFESISTFIARCSTLDIDYWRNSSKLC